MSRIFLLISFVILFNSCQNTTKVHDVVVIGGGLMGSSSGWGLAKSGQKVLLIEQQDSTYTFGSSFGEARISRSLGVKDDIFSYLQQKSVDETNKLIEYLNESENSQRHSMDDIYRTSPVTYIRYKSQEEEVNLLLDQQKDRFEYAPDSESAKNMFGMIVPDSIMIIREYEEYSGTLNPEVLISKLHKGITMARSTVWYNQKVIRLEKIDEFFQIEIANTKTGEVKTILSKKVVAAAGPYNGQLVQHIAPYFKKLITPKRLFLSFLKIAPSVYKGLPDEQKERLQQSYPVADISNEIYYSMIEKYDDEKHPIIKVGGHFLRTEIENLDEVWEKDLTKDEINWSKINTSRYLTMLDLPVTHDELEFMRGYSCVYSLTDTEVPYVTKLVDHNNEILDDILLVGGMSGIGAKGSLAYGLIASNMLLNKEDTSSMYRKTEAALGVERLLNDLSAK